MYLLYILLSNRLAAFVKGCTCLTIFWFFVYSKIVDKVFAMAPIRESPNDCSNGNAGHRDAMYSLEHRRQMDDLRRREVS